jgi:hypothetical protein
LQVEHLTVTRSQDVKPQKAHVTAYIGHSVLISCTMAALIYVLLAAYLVWSSADKDVSQAAVWFLLGVCCFCIGLIPTSVSAPDTADAKSKLDTSPDSKN